MIEIMKNLYVGNEMDYEMTVKRQEGWAIVHACKEPYHRQAVGYSGRACSKDHPEYLLARRGNRLILNLVDVEDPNWVHPTIVDTAMQFIDEQLNDGNKVLIHCNQGFSRSAGLGILYLAHVGSYSGLDYANAETEYKSIYPPYAPAGGMRGYIIKNWSKYCAEG
jgi:hypothetical protein